MCFAGEDALLAKMSLDVIHIRIELTVNVNTFQFSFSSASVVAIAVLNGVVGDPLLYLRLIVNLLSDIAYA